tara:strand:+ start:1212 stop:1505 length:294 start_codon:yes stop_codon:yes gene_type:complete
VRDNFTKKELVNSIYMQLGFSKKISDNIVEDFINVIVDNLIQDKKVKISNFGTFFLKRKKSRIGRNPKTKEKKIISERNVITFKASKEFKNYINKNE